jgi:uncharacterized protein (UPF0332 family)
MTAEERKVLIKHRIERAKESIEEARLLFENEKYNATVNRLYYACYYSLIALLFQNNIETKTHAGARQMLGLHFVKLNRINSELAKFYSQIFDARQTGDYDDFVSFEKEEISLYIENSSAFIDAIQNLIDDNE